MNFNIDLFEKTEAKEFGEFENLELGGHEIVILDAREYTSDISGNTSLKISVDTTSNDKQPNFFTKQYNENNNADKKWSTGAVRYLSLKDEQLAYLKGFITAVENSNSGFKFNTKGTWEQLKGKKLAGQFGLEEFTDSEGKTKTATKLIQFRSLEKLSEIKIPKVKLLNGTFVDYEEYQKHQGATNNIVNNVFDGNVEVSEDDLPFEV